MPCSTMSLVMMAPLTDAAALIGKPLCCALAPPKSMAVNKLAAIKRMTIGLSGEAKGFIRNRSF